MQKSLLSLLVFPNTKPSITMEAEINYHDIHETPHYRSIHCDLINSERFRHRGQVNHLRNPGIEFGRCKRMYRQTTLDFESVQELQDSSPILAITESSDGNGLLVRGRNKVSVFRDGNLLAKLKENGIDARWINNHQIIHGVLGTRKLQVRDLEKESLMISATVDYDMLSFEAMSEHTIIVSRRNMGITTIDIRENPLKSDKTPSQLPSMGRLTRRGRRKRKPTILGQSDSCTVSFATMKLHYDHRICVTATSSGSIQLWDVRKITEPFATFSLPNMIKSLHTKVSIRPTLKKLPIHSATLSEYELDENYIPMPNITRMNPSCGVQHFVFDPKQPKLLAFVMNSGHCGLIDLYTSKLVKLYDTFKSDVIPEFSSQSNPIFLNSNYHQRSYFLHYNSSSKNLSLLDWTDSKHEVYLTHLRSNLLTQKISRKNNSMLVKHWSDNPQITCLGSSQFDKVWVGTKNQGVLSMTMNSC